MDVNTKLSERDHYMPQESSHIYLLPNDTLRFSHLSCPSTGNGVIRRSGGWTNGTEPAGGETLEGLRRRLLSLWQINVAFSAWRDSKCLRPWN